MAEALCIRCGAQKAVAWKTCGRCGFDPTSNEAALVKSVYLSTARFASPARKQRYRAELDDVASTLEQGKELFFDEAELQRLAAQKQTLDKVPMSSVWGAVARLFLPAIILIAALIGLAFLLRHLN